MVQHVLLTLVAPPLIAIGRPVQVVLRGLRPRYSRALLRHTIGRPWVRRWLAALVHPVTVVLLANASFLLWHVPVLYQAAVRSRPLHVLEHACFFGTAFLFWWVLVDPVPRHHRLSPTAALLGLFATWMVSDLLGATLTLARVPFYPLYGEATNPWRLTPLADQRLGGSIMWIGGGGFYAAAMLGMLAYPYARRRLDSPSRRRIP
jgi:cytochrome c oxidase assembly factor CtaG